MRIPIFILFVIALFTACGTGGSNQAFNEQERPSEESIEQESIAPDSYSENLTATTADKMNFPVYEARALELLNDYGDYLQLISDDTYEQSLRDHAVSMVTELFEKQSTIVDSMLVGTMDELKVKQLFMKLNKQSGAKVSILLQDIRFVDSFSEVKDGVYRGSIAFSQLDEQTGANASRKVDVVLMKKNKLFGNKSRSIWKVLLSDIR